MNKELEKSFLKCLEEAERWGLPWVLHPNAKTLRNRLKTVTRLWHAKYALTDLLDQAGVDRGELEELQRMGLVELSLGDGLNGKKIWLLRFTEQGMAFADNTSPV